MFLGLGLPGDTSLDADASHVGAQLAGCQPHQRGLAGAVGPHQACDSRSQLERDAALRDLALVVDLATPAADVRKALAKSARTAAGSAFAVESVEVFDVYQGKGLPDGKKSLAFSLSFRSAERTLTDDEVNVAFTKLQADIVADGRFSVRA